jgi:hypothetical protein
MIYTFEFVGVNGRIGHLDLGVFADDAEAASAAKAALADHVTAVRVDVWNEHGRILGIDRSMISGRGDGHRRLSSNAQNSGDQSGPPVEAA